MKFNETLGRIKLNKNNIFQSDLDELIKLIH